MKRMLTAFSFLLGVGLTVCVYRWHTCLKLFHEATQYPDTLAIMFTGVIAALVAMWGILSQRAITRRQVIWSIFPVRKATKT